MIAKLNNEQIAVVKHSDGPLLVLAGAGSGKTTALIHRTGYLIQKKRVRPWKILIVTFTNKAANELKDRLRSSYNLNPDSLWVGTFHSICRRILQVEIDKLGFKKNFSIYDTSDSNQLIKQIIKKLDLDKETFPHAKLKSIISHNKNNLITPANFFDHYEDSEINQMYLKIYKIYQSKLKINNALDFDDLILQCANLLSNNEDVRKKYEKKFDYVMIDEYQDTNVSQFKLIYEIAKNKKNICAVGDDDQAIYSWRGASIKNILNFESDYQGATKIKLEQNYRSTMPILDLANQLISHNNQRHEKSLWTSKKSDDKPILTQFDDEQSETIFIAEKILELKNSGIQYSEIVILYRTNALSRVYEGALNNYQIPYQIVGGTKFFNRKEVKDILAYLRVIANLADNTNFERLIIETISGIGKTTVDRLLDFAYSKGISLYQTIMIVDEVNSLRAAAKTRLKKFLVKFDNWINFLSSHTITELLEKIIEDIQVLEKYENSNDIQDISRGENIKELVATINTYESGYQKEFQKQPDLPDFLSSISLQAEVDTMEDSDDCVKLMTMHNAKGLEFDVVFVVGLEEGILPHERSNEDEIKVQEERRLLYVAITRARKFLYLSQCKIRRIFNQNMFQRPSRFIAEIEDFVDSGDKAIFYKAKSDFTFKPKKKVILETQKFYQIGQKVKHKTFGVGTILSVENSGKDSKLTISFNSGRLKKIIGSFIEKI